MPVWGDRHSHRRDRYFAQSWCTIRLGDPILPVSRVRVAREIGFEECSGCPVGIIGAERVRHWIVDPDNAFGRVDFLVSAANHRREGHRGSACYFRPLVVVYVHIRSSRPQTIKNLVQQRAESGNRRHFVASE